MNRDDDKIDNFKILGLLIVMAFGLLAAVAFCSIFRACFVNPDHIDRVMPDKEKAAYSQRLGKKVYVGRDNKRPFIVTCDGRVFNGKEWVKY